MPFFKKSNKLDKRHQTGKKAEVAAKQYLQRQGLKLLKQNYYCRFGEIDLIMQDSNTLVFIEVRCRKSNAQVSAAESISPKKIQKIKKTAQYFLLELNTMPNCRFDVMAMTHNDSHSGYNIDWIQNAF